MRKLLLWTAICLLSCTSLPAQPWFQLGTEWNYSMDYFTGMAVYSDHDRLRVVADTMVGGQQAKLLDYTNNWLGIYINEFVYEESDRVYMWRDSVWTKLYDFNLGVGDTWWVLLPFTDPITGLDSAQYRVDSVGTETYNGVPLRYQHINRVTLPSGFFYSDFKLVERMGSLGFFTPVELGFIGPPYGKLRCYSDSTVGLWDRMIVPTCDFDGPLVGMDDPATGQVDLEAHPNPAQDRMRLEVAWLGDWQLDLLDLRGKRVKRWTLKDGLEKEVEVGDLPRGVYVLKGRDGEGRQGIRRVLLR